MTDLMQKALAAVRNWGAERQNEAAALLLAIDRMGPDAYPASKEELAAMIRHWRRPNAVSSHLTQRPRRRSRASRNESTLHWVHIRRA